MDEHYSRQIPHIIEKVIFSPWLITAGGYQAVQMLIASKLAKEAPATSELPTLPGSNLPYVYSTNTTKLIGVTQMTPVAFDDDFQGTSVSYLVDSEGIATIPIRGVLGQRLSGLEKICGGTDYLDIQKATQEAIEKRYAKGVLYAFDSSGGMVRGCSDLAEYIKELPVPTQAYTDSRCNSAAYWLASACNGVMSSASADVGSIGVILPWIDKTKVWELEGLSYDPFINEGADLKGAGAGPTMTKAQRMYLQDSVNFVGEKFQSFVSEQRKVKPVVFRAGTYFGEQALDVGLIDKVGTQLDAYNTLLTRVKNKQNGDRAPVPKTIQGKTMTKEELQAQHPELYASLVQENETSARAALEAARAQERTRLSELDALAFTTECRAIVDAAKADGRTAQAIGLQIAGLLAKDNEHLQLQVGVYKGAKPAAGVAGIDPLSLEEHGSEKQLTSRLSAHFAKRLGTTNGRKN